MMAAMASSTSQHNISFIVLVDSPGFGNRRETLGINVLLLR
jgi:hypothetical protein